jgi:PAS domain S-box-containing protein
MVEPWESLGQYRPRHWFWLDAVALLLGLSACGVMVALIWTATASPQAHYPAQDAGTRFWAELALACQLAAVGLGVASILMRRRLARTNALLSEQAIDLSTTLRSIGDAVITADVDGRITRMNPVAESLTGWTTREAVGRPLVDVFHAVDARTHEPIVPPTGPLLQEGGTATVADDTILTARDGAERHVVNTTAPISNGNGRIQGTVLVFHDMTAEYDVREELRESESLHRELMKNLPAGIVIIDPDTRVIENINPYAAALFGAPEDQIVGNRCHAFLCPAEERACPICDLNQTVDNSERVMLRANGSRIPILKSVKRIQVRGRDKLLECFVNISAHKRMEDDLQRAKQALEQHVVALRFANQALEQSTRIVESGARAKSELMTNMSHEIRTVETAIVGFAERLLAEPGLEKAPLHRKAALQTIARNGRRMLTIIDEILNLSDVEDSDHVAPRNVVQEVSSSPPPARLDCRVLLAEDAPDIQVLIAALLRDKGAEVKIVDNGQLAVDEVWAAIRDGRPFDVVLMDIHMPILDGCAAAQRLRLEGYEGRIIALTTRCKEADHQKYLASGCNDLITKPIDNDRLIALVAESAAAARAAKPTPSDDPTVHPTPGVEDTVRS